MASGPLSGLKIVEYAGIGPGPFCGMLLSDLGADVVRIDRKTAQFSIGIRGTKFAVTERGRRSIALDLKQPAAIETCLRLAEQADAIFEGFRPGVMERLGLGPAEMLGRNPALVYGRMSGWGQTGPWANAAGHDINYIAVSGALDAIGTREKPLAPLNLVGDFGGGALYLAFGLLAGVLHARETGVGQIVDAAMSDGAASLMAFFYGLKAAGMTSGSRQDNLLDGGAHFYDTYQCSDGKWVSVGAIEPQFYRSLLERAGITDSAFGDQMDRDAWPGLKDSIAGVMLTRTRDQWCEIMEGADACFAPVLDMDEAPRHPHNIARGSFFEESGVVQPSPAPRFSVTPGAVQGPPPAAGAHNEEALLDWGFSSAEIQGLMATSTL
jgi:alpha-methylacyl-CoA racemase